MTRSDYRDWDYQDELDAEEEKAKKNQLPKAKCETQVAMVLVTEGYLKKLERSLKLLQALEAGGVDNWEGYHHATRDFYREELDEDE